MPPEAPEMTTAQPPTSVSRIAAATARKLAVLMRRGGSSGSNIVPENLQQFACTVGSGASAGGNLAFDAGEVRGDGRGVAELRHQPAREFGPQGGARLVRTLAVPVAAPLQCAAEPCHVVPDRLDPRAGQR